MKNLLILALLGVVIYLTTSDHSVYVDWIGLLRQN